MRRAQASTALLVLLALLACKKKSVNEVIAAHSVGVEGTFAKLKQLEAVVTSAPPVETEGVKPTGEQVVVERGSKQNAVVVNAADLSDVTNVPTATLRTSRTEQLAECASILRTKHHLGGTTKARGEVADEYLGHCARVRYVFVVRPHHYEAPAISGANRFRPGKFTGDVTLWQLDTRASFGGFKVTAESKSITLGPRDSVNKIDTSFAWILAQAVDDGIRKHVPGAIEPPR